MATEPERIARYTRTERAVHWVHAIAFTGITSIASSYWPWTGGNDLAVSLEWRWTDGAMFWLGPSNGSAQGGLYANWVGGSPSKGGNPTDCIMLQYSSYWKDWGCDSLQPYVCEQY